MAVIGLPAGADPAIDRAVQYYQTGNYQAASDSLLHVQRINATAMYYQACCQQQLGNAAVATKIYQRLTEKFPTSPEAKLAARYLSSTAMSQTRGSHSSQTAPSATQPVSRERLPDSTSVPFRRAAGNHMLVNAIVNGRPIELMFDTGASGTYFGRPLLERAGIRLQSTGQKGYNTGVSGQVEVEVCLAEIQLGDIVRTIPVSVANAEHGFCLLGENFFNPFRYDIDSSAGVIHFYKKGGSSSEGFDTINIPFVPESNEMRVTFSINGRPFQAYFDTGAGATTICARDFASLGLQIPSDHQLCHISGVGGDSVGYVFNVDRVSLGPIQKTNFRIIVAGSSPVSLIGQDFFKDKRFTIDNENRVIKFSRN
jgi:predicted aspartyl protease